ncbi:(3R)-3-hydroxyacyl-CoA dehydrogenase-like isoform X1 [Haemaphysalis longicornis]
MTPDKPSSPFLQPHLPPSPLRNARYCRRCFVVACRALLKTDEGYHTGSAASHGLHRWRPGARGPQRHPRPAGSFSSGSGGPSCHTSVWLDVGSTESVGNLFADIKETESLPVSIVVNSAAIARKSLLVDTTDEDFDKVMQTNVKGTFLMTREAARSMIASAVPNGVIVNVASIAAKTGMANFGAYTASKGAVVALTKTAAQELGPHGIRCNAVLPGATRTPMAIALVDESEEKLLAASTPLGRFGQPEEVAEAIAFLCFPNSSYVTGAAFEVTGGFCM